MTKNTLVKYKGKFYGVQFKGGKITKHRLARKTDWKGKKTFLVFR